jgi:hypothetical protein
MPVGIHFALNILQQLTGMKGSEYSLLIVSAKPAVDAWGIGLHLFVLAGALLLTKKMSRPHAVAGTDY